MNRAAEEQPAVDAADVAVASRPTSEAAGPRRRISIGFDTLAAGLLALAAFALYVATLAPTALRSDSGEFHVVPWVLGIAHAPGYPLLTLLARAAMLLPIGDPAYRVNLLDAAAAAAAAGFVYLAIVELAGRGEGGKGGRGEGETGTSPPIPPSPHLPISPSRVGGLAGAAALALGATYWQQSVVGGPRPLTFLFTALLLWLAFRWGNRVSAEGPGRASLVPLGVAAGLALAHHPNHAMLFPGLALYLLGRDPRLVLRWRQVGTGLVAFVLPLLLYLYLPIRSWSYPPLGPLELANPRELLIYVTAAHYQDTVLNNCGGSRLLQAQRYLVLLLLQYGPLLPALAGLGALLTLVRAPLAGLVLLYAFASNATFGICSQLAMPEYVIPSYIVAAIWIGLAIAWPLGWLLGRRSAGPSSEPRMRPVARAISVAAAGLVLGLSAYRLVTGLPYQSMAGRTADLEWARAGMSQAQADGAILSDWESITPLWYAQHVDGLNRTTRTGLVTAAPHSDRWLVEVEKSLALRPVMLAQSVPALGDKYRLFPIGSLFDVPQRAVTLRGDNLGLRVGNEDLRLLGYRLDRPAAAPGELIRLTLYQTTDRGTDEPYLPVVRLGGRTPVEYRFDGALRQPSTDWSNDEVAGEVYEFAVPSWVEPGELPVELAYRADGKEELLALAGGRPWTTIGTIAVTPPRGSALGEPPGTLANFADQLVLRGGRLSGPTPVDLAGDPSAARLQRGGVLDLELRWSALRWMDQGYTLFVHLLDADNRLVAQVDELPLGGIYHTYKWVPGQVIVDRYRLPLPAELPPGEYALEIGAYQSTTTRRLPLLDRGGGSTRTSYRWGPLRVE